VKTRTWLAAAAAAALCAGCRAGGGIDRSDSATGMRFATDCVAHQTRDDCVQTRRTLSSAPAAFARSFSDGVHDLRADADLYLGRASSR
jgi:hypothetical protein